MTTTSRIDKVITKTNCAHFDSVSTFIAESMQASASGFDLIESEASAYAARYLTRSHDHRLGWFGDITREQLDANFINREVQDKAVQKRIHDNATTPLYLSNASASMDTFDMYNDEHGLMLDSNAYFNGEEDCMINVDVIQKAKPVIWLACSFGASAGHGTDYFVTRGTALISVIHCLERAGVSVGLVAYKTAEINGRITNLTCVVKEPQNSLDEATLINTFATPALFRHYAIAWLAAYCECESAGHSIGIKVAAFDTSFADTSNLVIIPQNIKCNDYKETTKLIIDMVRANVDGIEI